MSVLLAVTMGLLGAAQGMQVGVGQVVITPEEPMWLAGYAARTKPFDGKIHDLYAKALAFEDHTGQRSVIVTTDLLGIPARVAHATADLVQERCGIPRARLMLTASHTHCGPVVRDGLIDMYAMDDVEAEKTRRYTEGLPALLVQAVEQALANLEPGTLGWGIGTASFAGNRRAFTLGGVTNAENPIGPVDHDVPVLAATNRHGDMKAVLFGYACHNTTLSVDQLCGDYAGFAQAFVEDALPNVTALFVAGCGGDQNPLPRRSLDLAQLYGDELGVAVLRTLEGPLAPVHGPIRAKYKEIPLPLSTPPTRAEVEQQAQSENVYIQRRARRLLNELDERGELETTYPYPVQVWQFANTLQLTALAGEVVVDYSLRLKHELGGERQFIIAYANDVFAYIPSLRVLREGGYEGESAMIYYGLYGPWAPTVEELIVSAVHELTERKPLVNVRDVDEVRARRPLLIAHRGGVVGKGVPECSRAALDAAVVQGYDMVELDVQATRDGFPVVFHDGTLQRAAGMKKQIKDMPLLEVEQVRYKANDQPIMTLDEALGVCRQHNLGVMLDIKSGTSAAYFRRIRGLIEKHGLVQATMCINDRPEIHEHLGDAIMLRVPDAVYAGIEGGDRPDLTGRFWFGQSTHLPSEMVPVLQELGALVIPALNTFRYDKVHHRAQAKADAQRMLAAEVDGFQIDSMYQDFFDD
jgi:hypothetical protein